MSEYLSKQAVLEWLESEMSISKGHPDDVDVHWTFNRVAKTIQSGAFDAPDMEHINAYWAREGSVKHQQEEIQRLRAALERIAYETHGGHVCAKIASEALSTTSEPCVCESIKCKCGHREPTVAERVREIWNNLRERGDLTAMDAVEKTLNAVGAVVPGINAPDEKRKICPTCQADRDKVHICDTCHGYGEI